MKTNRLTKGFTLMEILVVIVIIAALVLIATGVSRRLIERAKWTADVGNLRQIWSGVVARSVENNDRAYTKPEIGKSLYREYKDPLSLCQVLKDYVGETTWISPAANKRQKLFKNSYAWTAAANITDKPLSLVENPKSTPIVWNCVHYTLPSVYNVPEATSGPSQASKQYQYRPWNGKTQMNWFYLDGHVETK